jgi:hypothetical protein
MQAGSPLCCADLVAPVVVGRFRGSPDGEVVAANRVALWRRGRQSATRRRVGFSEDYRRGGLTPTGPAVADAVRRRMALVRARPLGGASIDTAYFLHIIAVELSEPCRSEPSHVMALVRASRSSSSAPLTRGWWGSTREAAD